MVQGYTRQIKDILRSNGWRFQRPGKGDHEIWSKADCKPVVVDGKVMSRHTANAILKQAGIKAKL